METTLHHEHPLAQALISNACRRIDPAAAGVLSYDSIAGQITPVAGHLVLAEVLELGANRHLHLANGCTRRLRSGQRLVVTLGQPYAPLGHSGRVPAQFEDCDLLNDAGIAGREIARAPKLATPTRLRVLGLLCDSTGLPLNLCDFAIDSPSAAAATREAPLEAPLQTTGNAAITATRSRPRTLLVISCARQAQAGRVCLALARGLVALDARLAAVKLTGEIEPDFLARLSEAGAKVVMDTIDAGYSSSYGISGPALLDAADRLVAEASRQGADVVLMRIAGGLAQPEVRTLLATAGFAERFDGVVLAAADALSATAGAALMRRLQLPLIAVTGAIHDSPLASREALGQSAALGCPLVDDRQLADPVFLQGLLSGTEVPTFRRGISLAA